MSEQIISSRLQACAACEHNTHGFCGVPVLGTAVMHRGKEVRLCGCLMKVKARLPFASCPLDKWPLESELAEQKRQQILEDVVPEPAVISKPVKAKDLSEIRGFLASIEDHSNIPWAQMKRLVEIHTKYIYPVQETGCTPCLIQMIKNLKASVK